MKVKIYVTGFEPFGGRTTNTSLMVSNLVNCDKRFELKVGWDYIDKSLDDILLEEPDVLILMGEAGSYKNMTIERVAHNIANGLDNYGIRKDNEKINDELDNLETKVDVSFNDVDYISGNDAGKYLCNFTYYKALEKTLNKKTKVLFIHYPYTKDDGGEFSLEDFVNRTNRIIKYLKA